MKLFRTILVGLVGAVAMSFAGPVVLSMLGVALGQSAAIWLAVAGFALGAAASALESKALYGVLALLLILSAFSVLMVGSMPAEMWVTKILLKITASSGWMAYAIWFGVHLVAIFAMAEWMKDPTLSVGEAVGGAISTLTSALGEATGGILVGLLGGVLAVLTNNPILLVAAGLFVWYRVRGRYGAAGRLTGSQMADRPEDIDDLRARRTAALKSSYEDGGRAAFETATLTPEAESPRPQPLTEPTFPVGSYASSVLG